MLTVTFQGPSLVELRYQMQDFLTMTVKKLPAAAGAEARDPFPDTGFEALLDLDGPLPPAVKRPMRPRRPGRKTGFLSD